MTPRHPATLARRCMRHAWRDSIDDRSRRLWRNHPAVRMWRGHELALAEYAEIMCVVWRMRGFKDTLRDQFRDVIRNVGYTPPPNWLGYDRLHASHRSNLLRKDATHYGQFGWQEPADLPYWWPMQREAVA